MRIHLLLLAGAFVVAGCSDSKPACDPEDPACGGPPPTRAGTGVIVGVVVDETITTLEGVTVEVIGTGLTTPTDAQGRFSFVDLEPKDYFVRASKPGYHPSQQSVAVVADNPRPPVLRVLLSADPASKPYFEAFSWTGFLECSVGVMETPITVGASAVEACFFTDNSDNVRDENISGLPTFAQSEMIWDGTGDVGQTMQMSYYVPDSSHTDGNDDFATAMGLSPLVLQGNTTEFEPRGVGTDLPLGLRVFPGGDMNDPVTLFFQHEFTVYTHVFYNMLPPEGWRFSEHGDPPVPQ